MIDKLSIINTLKNRSTKRFLKDHQMKHIWLAWSIAKNSHTNESDIDIVYEFDTTVPLRWWWIISAKVYLEKKFDHHVDILDKDILPTNIKSFITSSMELIW